MSAHYRIKADARLPGTQYIPANASEGCEMFDQWCSHCARDKPMRDGDPIDSYNEEEFSDDEVCEIIGASFLGNAIEWRKMPDGAIKCLAFVEYGHDVPPPRDDKTIDMFGDAA